MQIVYNLQRNQQYSQSFAHADYPAGGLAYQPLPLSLPDAHRVNPNHHRCSANGKISHNLWKPSPNCTKVQPLNNALKTGDIFAYQEDLCLEGLRLSHNCRCWISSKLQPVNLLTENCHFFFQVYRWEPCIWLRTVLNKIKPLEFYPNCHIPLGQISIHRSLCWLWHRLIMASRYTQYRFVLLRTLGAANQSRLIVLNS